MAGDRVEFVEGADAVAAVAAEPGAEAGPLVGRRVPDEQRPSLRTWLRRCRRHRRHDTHAGAPSTNSTPPPATGAAYEPESQFLAPRFQRRLPKHVSAIHP